MNRLTIKRINGNVPKTIPGEDYISGLMAYIGQTYPTGFSATDQFKTVSTMETAEALGITADNEDWCIKVLHYQLSELFRINPAVILYIGLSNAASTNYNELKALMNYADGKLRQIGIWDGRKTFTAADITALQGIGTYFETQNTPCSIIYSPKLSSLAQAPSNLAVSGQKNVSVVIAQDGAGTAKDLYEAADNTSSKSTVGIVGIVLGLISLASVHESIAWVKKFPSGVSVPAFGDGTLYNSVDKAVIEALDTSRYIFLRTYPGLAGSYINDSHTLDLATSDYAFIEAVRTMDKAVRGITTYMLPELGAPLKVNADTGKLDQGTVSYLQTVAGFAIEEMEKAGELSGYSVEIDPEQNVLSTSTVEIVIKNVQIGVMRVVNIKIGFAPSL